MYVCVLHDGRNFVALEKIAAENRRKTDSSQRIAPFIDGRFPDAGMFTPVNCENVSQNGFTFLAHESPAFDKVLLALGDGRNRAYAWASVKNSHNIGSDSDPLYRVPGQF